MVENKSHKSIGGNDHSQIDSSNLDRHIETLKAELSEIYEPKFVQVLGILGTV